MYVYPRIGPWPHAEVRNGGLPDWVLRNGAVRQDDSGVSKEAGTSYAAPRSARCCAPGLCTASPTNARRTKDELCHACSGNATGVPSPSALETPISASSRRLRSCHLRLLTSERRRPVTPATRTASLIALLCTSIIRALISSRVRTSGFRRRFDPWRTVPSDWCHRACDDVRARTTSAVGS